MEFSEIVKLAFRNVKSNLLRSILTISIIAIGIMALVGILTALDGITYALNDSFSGLGANSFELHPKSADARGHGGRRRLEGPIISFHQSQEFKSRFQSSGRVSVSFDGTFMATAKHKKESTNPNVQVLGVDEDYLVVNGNNLTMGRGFSPTEVENGSHKAIIGKDLVDDLYNGNEQVALGSFITISDVRFRVIGILESKGSGMGGGMDRIALIPLSVSKMLYDNNKRSYKVVIKVNESAFIDKAIAETTGLFRQVRRLRVDEVDDFEIEKSDSMIAMFEENTATLRIATISIGLITLLGAAIGLMNIMLVSVTERTKEIGINKALGAKRSDILTMFLLEALIIGQIGGLFGILLGVLVGNIIPLKMGGQFLMPWGWLFLGVILCLVVGLLSGYYPARKAAKLDPIESLRHE